MTRPIRASAVQNTRKLIDEDHVDAIIGSTVTPNSAARCSMPHPRRQDAGDLDRGFRGDHLADGRQEARMGLQDRRRTTALMADAIAELAWSITA